MSQKSNYIDQIYNYKGAWEIRSLCGLKIVKKGSHTIVIVSEMYETNPGSSVTSCIDKLANEIIDKFGIEPDQMMFIEHYPDRKSNLEFFRETFDLVQFDWDGSKFMNPNWKRIKREDIDQLIS